MDNPYQSPVLIGCCPSSGSTLLSTILDAHSKLFSGNELNLFSHPFFWKEKGAAWRSRLSSALFTPLVYLKDWTLDRGFVPYANLIEVESLPSYGHSIFSMSKLIKSCNSGKELADRFWAPVLKRYGKSIWVEKSPSNLYGLPYFLETYAEGKGIVVVRDGRDVVCSLRKRGYTFGAAVSRWLIDTAMAFELSKSSRVLLVRYEDLVFATQSTLKEITAFLEVEPETERLLNYTVYTNRNLYDAKGSVKSWNQHPAFGIQPSSVNRWKQELTMDEQGLFYSYAIAPSKTSFLPDTTLPEMTAMDLLMAFSYEVPEQAPLDHLSMGRFLSGQSIARGETVSFHEINTRLHIPGREFPSVALGLGTSLTRTNTLSGVQRIPARLRLLWAFVRKFVKVMFHALKLWIQKNGSYS